MSPTDKAIALFGMVMAMIAAGMKMSDWCESDDSFDRNGSGICLLVAIGLAIALCVGCSSGVVAAGVDNSALNAQMDAEQGRLDSMVRHAREPKVIARVQPSAPVAKRTKVEVIEDAEPIPATKRTSRSILVERPAPRQAATRTVALPTQAPTVPCYLDQPNHLPAGDMLHISNEMQYPLGMRANGKQVVVVGSHFNEWNALPAGEITTGGLLPPGQQCWLPQEHPERPQRIDAVLYRADPFTGRLTALSRNTQRMNIRWPRRDSFFFAFDTYMWNIH